MDTKETEVTIFIGPLKNGDREREKKEELDIVLLTFTVEICNAYRLENIPTGLFLTHTIPHTHVFLRVNVERREL